MNKDETLRFLKKKHIPFDLYEHEAVFTMEEMKQQNLPCEKDIAVNLFLRDDKKRNYYLITFTPEHRTDLNALRHIIGSRRLSFASENDLEKMLKLKKGNVTPLAALNDEEHTIHVFVDVRFKDRMIGVHPMENTATVYMKADDLFELLKDQGCDISWADFRQIL